MQRLRFALVFVILVLAAALTSCARPPTPPTHLQAGQAALDKGDTTTAIRELETVIGDDPKLVEARILLGRAYEQAGRQDDAINQYRAAVQLQSSNAEVGYHLGKLLVNGGKPTDAVVPLAMGYKLDASVAISFTSEISEAIKAALAASSELMDKDPQQAVQLLEAITTLDAGNIRAHLLLGNTYINLGQSAAAIEQYQAILALEPKNANATTNLGAAYYQMGKLDEAVAQFQAALVLTPDDAETHYLLGAAFIQQNKIKDAQAEFQTALQIKPNLAAAHIGLGNAQLLQQDLDGAIASLTRAAQLAPDAPEAFYALGKALAQKGDRDGAKQAFQRFLVLNPPASLRAEVEGILKQLGP